MGEEYCFMRSLNNEKIMGAGDATLPDTILKTKGKNHNHAL